MTTTDHWMTVTGAGSSPVQPVSRRYLGRRHQQQRQRLFPSTTLRSAVFQTCRARGRRRRKTGCCARRPTPVGKPCLGTATSPAATYPFIHGTPEIICELRAVFAFELLGTMFPHLFRIGNAVPILQSCQINELR